MYTYSSISRYSFVCTIAVVLYWYGILSIYDDVIEVNSGSDWLE